MLTSALPVLALSVHLALSAIVNTPSGEVKGTTGKSRDGLEYHKFLGVPYAKPPVGKLRLKNPELVEKWDVQLDCTKKASMCTQAPIFMTHEKIVIGKEDCLYLNVFTPNVSPSNAMAVLVYIHGGGFRCGVEQPDEIADYFMDENVVLVTIQYRLGSLGFLSMENDVIPGNFGLKDQSMALRWIKNNIKSFGGDSNKITVFGESAGGASTHYHTVSPLSKGLIRGSISESGVLNKLWAVDKTGGAKKKANRVLELVGCDKSSSPKEILICLQDKKPEDIIKTEYNFLFWDFDPAIVFQPVIEPEGEGAFMTKDPTKIKTNMPWLTGVTTDEGIFKTSHLVGQDQSVVDEFVDNFDEYIMKIFFFTDDDLEKLDLREAREKIKKRYFSDLNDRKKVLKGLEKLYSDAFFFNPMDNALDRNEGPTYVYVYGYRGANSLIDHIAKGTKFEGVSHVDELLALFNWSKAFPEKKEGDEEMSRFMVKIWSNFAKNQSPGVKEWETSKKGDHKYLFIGNEKNMKSNFQSESVNFWNEIWNNINNKYAKEEL